MGRGRGTKKKKKRNVSMTTTRIKKVPYAPSKTAHFARHNNNNNSKWKKKKRKLINYSRLSVCVGSK